MFRLVGLWNTLSLSNLDRAPFGSCHWIVTFNIVWHVCSNDDCIVCVVNIVFIQVHRVCYKYRTESPIQYTAKYKHYFSYYKHLFFEIWAKTGLESEKTICDTRFMLWHTQSIWSWLCNCGTTFRQNDFEFFFQCIES